MNCVLISCIVLCLDSASMSGGGGNNAEAGSSRSKAYWELMEELESQEMNPNYVPPDEEMEDADTSSDDEEEADGDDATTTNGGGGGEATDGGSQGSKKARKERTPITVGLIRQEFTVMTPKGEPKEPEDFAASYGLQVTAILWNTVTINTIGKLTSKENTHLPRYAP